MECSDEDVAILNQTTKTLLEAARTIEDLKDRVSFLEGIVAGYSNDSSGVDLRSDFSIKEINHVLEECYKAKWKMFPDVSKRIERLWKEFKVDQRLR